MVARLRANVELTFLPTEPQIDFAAAKLNPAVQDDFLLGSIVEFKLSHPGSLCYLATSDLGLSFKARHHGIVTIKLPENLRLPLEKDTAEKKIQQLEAENRELRRRIPELSLRFKGLKAAARFRLAGAVKPDPRKIESEIAKLRRQHPKISIAPKTPEKNPLIAPYAAELERFRKLHEQLTAPFGQRPWEPSNEQIESYNERLENFYQAYQRFLEDPTEINVLLRTIRIELEVWITRGLCRPMTYAFPCTFRMALSSMKRKIVPGFQIRLKHPRPPAHPADSNHLSAALQCLRALCHQ